MLLTYDYWNFRFYLPTGIRNVVKKHASAAALVFIRDLRTKVSASLKNAETPNAFESLHVQFILPHSRSPGKRPVTLSKQFVCPARE